MPLRLLAAAALALTGSSILPVHAQQSSAAPAAPTEASPALKARIAELPSILAGKGDYDSFFAPGFVAKVPKAQFDQVNAQLLAAGGPLVGITSVTPTGPNSATLAVAYQNTVATMDITVEPAEPHRVVGLLVTGVSGRAKTLGDVLGTIQGLPGRTGFAFARLGDQGPELIQSLHPNDAFAVGSAFKLVILSELVRGLNAGERHWTDTITLDGTPLPGGFYTAKPAGTKVTLRDLAEKMISISDNSATDLLLRTLGRAKVEAMLPVVGVADPARDRPYMSTLDMFKLKGIPGLAPRYLAASETGRRAMLEGEVAAAPLTAIQPSLFQDGKPVMIDQLEWFFTPADLLRIMDWLRRNTVSGEAAGARDVLAMNAPLTPEAKAKWRYVGFKGGYEPGVMSMTLLLQAQDGGWYALTTSWNNPNANVNQPQLVTLVGRAAELAAP